MAKIVRKGRVILDTEEASIKSRCEHEWKAYDSPDRWCVKCGESMIERNAGKLAQVRQVQRVYKRARDETLSQVEKIIEKQIMKTTQMHQYDKFTRSAIEVGLKITKQKIQEELKTG